MSMDGEMYLAGIGRVFEGGLSIAKRGRVPNRAIGTMCLEEERLVRAGFIAVDDNRQRLDVQADGAGRVLGKGRTRRKDHRHRLPDIAHLVMCKNRLMEWDERRKRLKADVDAWNWPGQVLGGDHRVHAGKITRRPCVDGFDPAMRDRTAQNVGVKLIFA